VPKNSKKIEEKIRHLGFLGFWGMFGKKREIRVFGWPTMGGYGGKGPEVVSWRWGRWWVVVGWRILDVREVRDG
jgi:hypothetical protein